MGAFSSLLHGLETLLTLLLRVGRWIAALAIGLMVAVTLAQVFFRYVLNNALPWPDEAARFFMLWMTGLIAPSAYRWGGFVAIEMLREALPKRAGLALHLLLLVVSFFVLTVALNFGLNHVNSGWLFASSSLKLPLEAFGLGTVPIKLAWMYMSLPVGFALMILVNIELVMKTTHMLIDPSVDYGDAPDQIVMSAE